MNQVKIMKIYLLQNNTIKFYKKQYNNKKEYIT